MIISVLKIFFLDATFLWRFSVYLLNKKKTHNIKSLK
jgi:hypothetical protein